ncbi:MAG: flavodoxin-dependent (E)-4-hydroxy-3-methylbut-2-enyl-diphosphate synthase [Spirochaetales bacterium]|nr:flavodoxin-dependent (E)-4-hydroxy-3-methylbut-2-enyl-diphosphate synthase [Spirochaetales bacterium]
MRRKTRQVKVKDLIIGGGFPVSVQTMWKEPLTLPVEKVYERIKKFAALGCDLLRIAVPKINDAEYVGHIAESSELPVIADIHFDYKIALRCMDFPVAKIRINPGNIGGVRKVEEVIKKAMDHRIPLRIGVNSGSLPVSLRNEKDTAAAMVKAAENELEILDRSGFKDVVFSLKSSEIETTVRATALFSEKYDFPLHLGVTEAGPLLQGTVKNTIALTKLLEAGIGDTIRISLSDSPENEIIVGTYILLSLHLKKKGITLISCPMCSRSVFNVRGFVSRIEEKLLAMEKDLTIAVMGCPVNGPGEAKKADLGITGSGNYAVIFRKGAIIKKAAIIDAPELFLREIERL